MYKNKKFLFRFQEMFYIQFLGHKSKLVLQKCEIYIPEKITVQI